MRFFTYLLFWYIKWFLNRKNEAFYPKESSFWGNYFLDSDIKTWWLSFYLIFKYI